MEEKEIIITDEQIAAMLHKDECRYNEGVVCPKENRNPRKCERCGWYPVESRRRILKFRKENYGSNRI